MNTRYALVLSATLILFCTAGSPIQSPLPISGKNLFDVTLYGAKADGSTNDTAAIQAAETAAEAVAGGATLVFPCGHYIVSTGPINITVGGIRWQSWCGIIGAQDSGANHGAILDNTNNSSATTVAMSPGASVNTQGPVIDGINFVYSGTTAATCISIHNYNQGQIVNSSFKFCNPGILFDGTSSDHSDWQMAHLNFTIGSPSKIGIQCTGGVPCQNNINDSYFTIGSASQAIVCGSLTGGGAGDGQLRITGNKFDASNTPSVATTSGIVTSCEAVISGNEFEDPMPAISVPWSSGNDGRHVVINNNLFAIVGANVQATCTTAISSTSISSCTGATGTILVGMEGHDNTGTTCIKNASLGSNFQLTGSTYVTVTNGSTTATLSDITNGSGCAASHLITFAFPVVRVPYTLQANNGGFPVIYYGNTYSNGMTGTGSAAWPLTDGQ